MTDTERNRKRRIDVFPASFLLVQRSEEPGWLEIEMFWRLGTVGRRYHEIYIEILLKPLTTKLWMPRLEYQSQTSKQINKKEDKQNKTLKGP